MRWLAGALAGAVLLVAGVAKLTSRGWPGQAVALGVPRSIGRVVPFVEIALGAGLVAGLPFAALAAIVLLVAFTAFIVVALLRGVEAPCACFGSLHARPLSWWSVVRNGGLLALVLFSLT